MFKLGDSKNVVDILKSLYDNAVNEFDNHPTNNLTDNEKVLIEKFKNVIKDTYNEYCEPSDRL